MVIYWDLWWERNDGVFSNGASCSFQVIHQVKQLVSNWFERVSDKKWKSQCQSLNLL